MRTIVKVYLCKELDFYYWMVDWNDSVKISEKFTTKEKTKNNFIAWAKKHKITNYKFINTYRIKYEYRF